MTDQEIALQIFSSDSYLSLNKKLLKILGPNSTVFICNLIDKFKYFQEKGMIEEDNSFFLIHESQIEDTGMSLKQIQTCKSKLKQLGVLKTYIKGLPPKEFYKINYEYLLEIYGTNIRPKRERINIPKGNELTSQKGTNIKENKVKENKLKENKESLSVGDLKLTIEEKESSDDVMYKTFSSRLKTIVQSVNKVHAGTRTNSWPEHFRKLHKIDKIPARRISAVLEWYLDNIGKNYVPECYSAQSFREKFVRLESAIDRDDSETTNRQRTRSGGASVVPGKYSRVKKQTVDQESEE